MGRKRLRYSAMVRGTHWVHAFSAIGTVATGLWIAHPVPVFGFKNMGLMHEIHMDLIWLLYGTLVLRLFYAVVSGDWRDFILRKEEWRMIPGMIAYYLFLRPSPPPYPGKYNPLQKLSIATETLLIIAFFPLGAGLFWPTYLGRYYQSLGLSLILLQRLIYYLTLVLAVMITVHIYLTCTENLEHFRAMLYGYEDPVRVEAQKKADRRNQNPPGSRP